ncbi:MAG TPA: hypothetical protein VFB23_04050 [Candidatus Acidoferrales bacterium]|nr:hypothetical protein [Candidatus Acidoferrales bacterium]
MTNLYHFAAAGEREAPDKRKRVLSGMRPTGRLHIGHYFGGQKPQVSRQKQAGRPELQHERLPAWGAY